MQHVYNKNGTIMLTDKMSIFDSIVLEDYIKNMLSTDVYKNSIKVLDVRNLSYHGGSTFSSGCLPKWDIYDIFIKACSLSSTGKYNMDATYEAYAMDLFSNTGVKIAQAVPSYVMFYNTELRKEDIRPCELAIKFKGNIQYYRNIRDSRSYGRNADSLIELVDDFPQIKVDLLNMFVVDFVMNQEDRHAKNFGILEDGSFAPLYDNGSSLYYNETDDRLNTIKGDEIAHIKFLGKEPIAVIKQYCEWLQALPEINFDIVLSNLDVIDIKYNGLISNNRLTHNRKVVERRVNVCKEILNL